MYCSVGDFYFLTGIMIFSRYLACSWSFWLGLFYDFYCFWGDLFFGSANVFSYCGDGVCCFVLFVELFESSWGYFLVGLLRILLLCCFVGVVVGTI